jgi:HSP20 family protein
MTMATAMLWRPLAGLQEELDRILASSRATQPAVRPAVNLGEDADHLYVEAIVPGATQESLELRVEDGVLRVSGEKQARSGEDVQRWHQRERASGKFGFSLRLPVQVNIDAITAEYTNGILQVTLPKAEAAKPKSITVQVK